jgi:hypothetical protein
MIEIEIDKEQLTELFEETAKLEHELNPLIATLSNEEWCEVLRRDLIARTLRRQNELQELIRHAKQMMGEREYK